MPKKEYQKTSEIVAKLRMDKNERKKPIFFTIDQKDYEVITPKTFSGNGLEALEFLNKLNRLQNGYNQQVTASEALIFSNYEEDYKQFVEDRKDHRMKYTNYIINLAGAKIKGTKYKGKEVFENYIDTFDNEKKSRYYAMLSLVDEDQSEMYQEAYKLIVDNVLSKYPVKMDWYDLEFLKEHKEIVTIYYLVWNAFFTQEVLSPESKENKKTDKVTSKKTKDTQKQTSQTKPESKQK